MPSPTTTITKVPASTIETKRWSGGTTSELFIWPKEINVHNDTKTYTGNGNATKTTNGNATKTTNGNEETVEATTKVTFASRNFNLRISKAVVETEESTFTPLDGVSRTLMVLEGELQLEHQGHHKSKLKPFMIDRFEGGWTTRSRGRDSFT
jgi:environmental stress-induced protein Ves